MKKIHISSTLNKFILYMFSTYLSLDVLFIEMIYFHFFNDILIHLQMGEVVLCTLILFSQLISSLAQETTFSGKTSPPPIDLSDSPFFLSSPL